MHRKHLLLAAAISASFLMLGCASTTTTMDQVRPEAEFQVQRVQRVLVIGVIQNKELRQKFEDEFVREWKAHGVVAKSSLEIIPSSVTLNKSEVLPIAKAHQCDTVLISRLLKREHHEAGKRTDIVAQTQVQGESSLEQVLQDAPVSATAYDLVSVETSLYDAASAERLWSGISHTALIGDVSKHIRPFVKQILQSLYEPPKAPPG